MTAAIIHFHVNCHLNLKKQKIIKEGNINHTHFKSSTPLVSYRNKEFILSFHGHVLEWIETLLFK